MRVIKIRKDQVDWSVARQKTKIHRKLVFFLGAVLDTLSQIIENAKGFEGSAQKWLFYEVLKEDPERSRPSRALDYVSNRVFSKSCGPTGSKLPLLGLPGIPPQGDFFRLAGRLNSSCH